MNRIIFLLISTLVFSQQVFGQDLLKERIRKLSSNKTSIYIEKGIFHNGGVKLNSSLVSIRQSFNAKQGFERLVFDFSSNQVPKIYGHMNSDDRKLYIDLFETTLSKEFKAVATTRYVDKVNFYPIESNHISIDLRLKSKVIADIFFLENPGRLVIDLKN